jgi:hypothetical protein
MAIRMAQMVHQSLQILNENQGAVMAILTSVYVLATLVLVEFSKRQAKTNQQTLDFLAKVEHARHRPYVIFDIVYRDLVAYASIRNIGMSSALKINVSVTPRLQWDDQSGEIAFIKTGLAFLAPNREVSEPLGTLGTMTNMYPEFKFASAVCYQDGDGRTYEEPFLIDLSYIKAAAVISPRTVADELGDISKKLERIYDALSEPMLMRLIPEREFQRQEEAKRQEQRERYEAHRTASAETQRKGKAESVKAQTVTKMGDLARK